MSGLSKWVMEHICVVTCAEHMYHLLYAYYYHTHIHECILF